MLTIPTTGFPEPCMARIFVCFVSLVGNDFGMAVHYKIATLLYVFNERDEILLLERAQEPNRGFWSPCGGKLKMDIGESPYVCACREAQEEIGLEIAPPDSKRDDVSYLANANYQQTVAIGVATALVNARGKYEAER